MDWLAGLGVLRLPLLIAFIWMLVPTMVLAQALGGLLRRLRLLQNAVPVEAEVEAIDAPGGTDGVPESTVVDLRVFYRVGEQGYRQRLTRTDHQRNRYEIGDVVGLLREETNPANAIDAQSHPWHDVIGPMVFGVLLFAFMGWLLLFLHGLR